MKDLRSKPRWLQQIRAFIGSYFWMPCPLCGEYFGGHEGGGDLINSWSSGEGVCKNCVRKANRLNKKFMKENPPPPVYVNLDERL